METTLTIQDIDVDQAHLIVTDIIVATAKKFGTSRYIESNNGTVVESIAMPLSLEL